jgi:GTP-binding protein HflX
MENKPAQNIQDTFLNTVRKDKTPITIYLVSGVKLTGKIRSFDKYSVLLENNSQEQLIFKHAISTVVSNRSVLHTEHRPTTAHLLQRRARPDPATLIGSGKVEEIAGVAASTEADLVLFDHDLTPTQLRNLEAALPCRVLDRTQLILDIFARHARTSEGQLQVELAQLEYMLPRLTGKGKAMSQLGGGIGTRGPGETKLETDRRRSAPHRQVKLDLDAVRRVRKQQRQRRESVPVPTVALVGYTNAGKSTLFNQLTGAQVLQSSEDVCHAGPKTASHRAAQPPQGAACRTRWASFATCRTRW